MYWVRLWSFVWRGQGCWLCSAGEDSRLEGLGGMGLYDRLTKSINWRVYRRCDIDLRVKSLHGCHDGKKRV